VSGVYPYNIVPDRKAIVRSDTGRVLGIFGDAYQPHHYEEWLVANVEDFLDDDLQIGSAGLLRGGGVAWVNVEVPDTIVTPEGVAFRPFLLAATSLDGSLATTYGRAITNTVCDNTMTIAMEEHGGQRFKVRHSSKSLGKLKDARDALGIIYSAADDFSRQVRELVETPFRDGQFQSLLDAEVPFPKDPKKAAGATKKAEEKREFLFDLYRFDARVKPWTGTAFGAWQAFNTFNQHENMVQKGTVREERNAWRDVNGQRSRIDAAVLGNIMELVA
jgi:phage/plasmid-like protein (TIGR03299 family)